MAKIKAGIIGGAGYTGGELIRLLLNHPQVEIRFVHSKSNTGNPLHKAHADLYGETELLFTGEMDHDVNVLFLCAGHGEGKKFLQEQTISSSIKIIDLSNDFRLKKDANYNSKQFVYGLPELNREEIKSAKNVANPGCFATAIELGLLPLAKGGLLKDVYTTGITGSTGAGQSLSETAHFSWRANNIQAYKTLTHQHLDEIGELLTRISGHEVDLSFVPWRGDFTRGIFVSSQLNCDIELKDLYKIYNDYYALHPFVVASREPIYLKQVVNTNKCLIQLEKVGSKLVVHSIVDNLLKGASGQAVQNMNLLFGLDETMGLRLKSTGF